MPERAASDGADRIAAATDDAALRQLVHDQLTGHVTTILESLPDALVLVDREGRMVLVNRQTERLFGYGRGELFGQPVEMLMPHSVRDAHRAHRAEYVARPQVVSMGMGTTWRLAARKDGAEFPIEISLSPLQTDAGLLVACTIRDVTERAQAARTTEMHLAVEHIVGAILRTSLVAKSLDELLEVALDQLLSVPWIALQSRGAVFLVGSSPETLTMKAQRGLRESVQLTCAQVGYGQCLCGLAADAGQAVFAGEIDHRHTTRYEGMLPHGHYCLPITSDGRLHGVMSLYLNEGHRWNADEETFLRSVTDVLAGAIVRLQLTEDLRRSEERFALALEGTDAGVWDWELPANRIFFSPRWKSMLGFGEQELPDDYLEWERRIHPEDRAIALATLHDYLDGRRDRYELEHRLLHRDGSYRWILSRGAAVRDEEGRPYRMVGSHLDITRSKNAEDAVRTNTAKLIAAQRIQEHILPRTDPLIEGFDIAGRLYPAHFAAGDHFDYLPMEGDGLGVMIGDVSGHGFECALVMASVHAYLRLLTAAHTDVAEVLRRVNRLLVNEIEVGRYVTLLLGRLDPATGTFTYANAGHPAGQIVDTHGRLKASLSSTSVPVGIMSEVPIPDAVRVRLDPGDVLVCVTDGMTEVESPAGVPFGNDGVFDVVRRNRYKSAREIIGALREAAESFSGGSTFSDDATIVVVKAWAR